MKSNRKDYVIKTSSTHEETKSDRNLSDTKYECMHENMRGSSSESSDGFDDSMEVEIELDINGEETKFVQLNDLHIQNFEQKTINKPGTVKNKTQKFNLTHGLYSSKYLNRVERPDKKPLNRISFPCRTKIPESLNRKKSKLFKQLQYKLRLAVEKGDIKTLKKLLSEIDEGSSKPDQIQIYLNSQGQDQWTLLHIATNEGNYSVVKFLLENGAHPNTQSVNQRTALHLA